MALNTIFSIQYSEDGVYEAELISAAAIGKKPQDPEQRWAFLLVLHVKD
jgi:hypothetical protein